MSLLERIRSGTLLKQLRQHRAISLPIILIILLVLAALIVTLVTLRPNWQQRQILVEELSMARNLSEQQAQLPRPDRTSLNAQVAALRQELLEAQESFISETEADAILNQIYGYAAISNVTIDALQTQTMVGEEGEQLPHTAFRLKASGSSIQLLNFVARIEQASKPGVELTNLSLLPGEPADITLLVMEVHFHTIPQVPDPPSPAPATEEPQEPEEPEEPDVAATLTPAPDDPASAE